MVSRPEFPALGGAPHPGNVDRFAEAARNNVLDEFEESLTLALKRFRAGVAPASRKGMDCPTPRLHEKARKGREGHGDRGSEWTGRRQMHGRASEWDLGESRTNLVRLRAPDVELALELIEPLQRNPMEVLESSRVRYP
jgi:hypothetical protein